MHDIASIDVASAAERIAGVVKRTPLVPFDVPDPSLELRLKLESFQVTGSFKARGAWNNVSQLSPAERRAGVVATSSGNHGRALSWAAQRAGVRATIFMPRDAYRNKIQACRDYGAEVVLCEDRRAAEEACAQRVAEGAVLIHPYDREGTVEGAGTVGLEIAEDWPEVEIVVVPVGGGGLVSGCALAVRSRLGARVQLIGVEPVGAPTLTRALREGRGVELHAVTTAVQGLCPPRAGDLNAAIARSTHVRAVTLEDEAIYAAQARLVQAGYTVEPAGAAAFALVRGGGLPGLARRRDPQRPLRVAAVVSGGNPDAAQLEAIQRA